MVVYQGVLQLRMPARFSFDSQLSVSYDPSLIDSKNELSGIHHAAHFFSHHEKVNDI